PPNAGFPGSQPSPGYRACFSGAEAPAPSGFCGVGRRRAKAVVVPTDEPFDEPTTQKTTALRVAIRRAPAASPGSTDGPASLFAWLLADRLAGRQRRLLPPQKIRLTGRRRGSRSLTEELPDIPHRLGQAAALDRRL